MKQIEFRKIDALMIKLSLNGKFFLLCSMVALITITIALINLNAAQKNAAASSQAKALAIVNTFADIAKHQSLSGNELANYAAQHNLLITQQTNLSRQGDTLIVTAPVGRQYLQLTSDVMSWEKTALENATMMLWVACFGLLPLFQLSYWTSTSLGGGLWDMYTAIKRVADGDLTQRLNFFGVDDFSLIASEIDRCADNMQEMVTAIGNNADTLSQAANEFTQQAQQSEQLIDLQHQFLDTTAAAMQQMSAAIEDVSGNAANTSEKTKDNANQAETSQTQISEAVNRISTLVGRIDSASESVSILSKNASEIGVVVTTINSISEQTNLLALNAAIEAARAGEQGRGFAVVADEVRTLAGRTQQATVEIQSMIEELQTGSTTLSAVTNEIVEQADQGRNAIVSVGDDVQLMAKSTNDVFDMSSQIAASAEEQSVSARDITQQLNDIREQSDTIQQTAQQSVTLAADLNQSSLALKGILAQYRLAEA